MSEIWHRFSTPIAFVLPLLVLLYDTIRSSDMQRYDVIEGTLV